MYIVYLFKYVYVCIKLPVINELSLSTK